MEPSWAILDALTPRGEARPDAGRGGEVNLPSRERQEDGKGNALDHLRPEGWWDWEGVHPSEPVQGEETWPNRPFKA